MAKQKISQKSKEKTTPKVKAIQALEDNDIFTLTNETTKDVKLLKNKRKNNETTIKKKTKNNEERKIKRIQEEMKIGGNKDKNIDKPKEEIVYDLWETNTKQAPKILIEPLKYPKVVIPHPGQSYNPNREDLKNLLHTIVEINKPKVNTEEEAPNNLELQEGKFEASEEEKEESEDDFKISNNPPVNDEDRLPRKMRNKIHNSKLNKLKNKIQLEKKKQKIDINSFKMYNNFQKEINKSKKIAEEEKKKGEEESKKNKELIKMGVYFKDTDVLDYKLNKKDVSLKNLTTDRSLISDRFENILKRNIVGEASTKKKRNRKLNKIHYRENQDFFFEEDDKKLKIIN